MIEGSIYSGFPVNNKDGGGNKYPGLNVNECSELCEITTDCLYFQYTGVLCYLKYGLLDRKNVVKPNSDYQVGYKKIAGYPCPVSMHMICTFVFL